MEPGESRSGGFLTAGAIRRSPFLVLMLSILPALSCFAGVRHFTDVYETPTTPAGTIDVENWVTWQRVSNPKRFDEVGFRHEIEFGVTEKFQASIYLADWFYASDKENSGFKYSDSAVELIYNLSNPVIDPVGLSIYQEFRGGDRVFEWESKIIAQKNFGPLILAYNVTLEAVWEGKELDERSGELQQALGVSYEISPRISIGVEVLHEFLFPHWRDEETIRNLFVGPNVSYRRGSWFVTATALAQATNTLDEADFQMRTITGFAF